MESFQYRYAKILDVRNLPNSIPFKIGVAVAITVIFGVVVLFSLGTVSDTTNGITGKSEKNKSDPSLSL